MTRRGALAATTVVAALVGLWLVSVLVFVLPSRDPDNVILWAIVTAVDLAAVAAAVAFLVRPATAIRMGLGAVGAVELVTGVVLVGAWVYGGAAIGASLHRR